MVAASRIWGFESIRALEILGGRSLFRRVGRGHRTVDATAIGSRYVVDATSFGRKFGKKTVYREISTATEPPTSVLEFSGPVASFASR